ncbi:apoptosis inhibitory protein 5-domain-containing protein [Mrakia frigida]|uniref:apoptosis inhibitory protein 5-domain-containing protein n=1 Tax=Mrakia frigida TaxID=29902 RepID=UPI003FCC0AE1
MERALSTVRTAGAKHLPLDIRRQAYAELISFSKSEDADVKKLVGRSIPNGFENFTSLQEEAVDAVYDLCEDVDMDVRIVGYKTFEQISRNVNAWVKRNTDVLIQLLQVETPEELSCIRELLLKHIRISVPPALAVIIDNLCSSESDDKKKEILLDILEVEGRTWIKNECMEPTSTGQENEDGKLLREGLEQVLRSSPPVHLRLKTYRLLAPLPHTSSTLPTSILLLQPSSKETHRLAFSCAQPPDSRAVVLNWYEGGGDREGGEVEEARKFCRLVRKWWEEERKDGARKARVGGVLGEGQEWEDKEVKERWRRVQEGLVSMLAVRVVGYWKQAKPASGMTSRPIPVPLMEPLLMTLAYLSEIVRPSSFPWS